MENIILNCLNKIAERSGKIQTVYKYKHEDEDFDISTFLIKTFYKLMESLRNKNLNVLKEPNMASH